MDGLQYQDNHDELMMFLLKVVLPCLVHSQCCGVEAHFMVPACEKHDQ